MTKKTPRGLSIFWVILTVILAIGAGLGGARWMHDRAVESSARNTVVWISIDGLRGDYVRRGELPFFARLIREAATTEKLRPAFPSTTFPSHSAQATGVAAEMHGITGNSFYDSSRRMLFSYPNDAALLQAEPIWLTAQRQGVRTAVYDWPLSFAQRGRVQTEFFLQAFDSAVPDQKRLTRLLDDWSASLAKPSPIALHLLMGYLVSVDKPGHVYGPDSPEILGEMSVLDGLLGDFSARVVEQWKRQRRTATDRLFLVFSTDHGMSPVTFLVNLDRLLDLPPHRSDFHVAVTGNVGHIFLDPAKFPPGSETREAKLTELREKVAAAGRGFQSIPRDLLPKEWAYAHPTRTGDLVIVLPRGFTFGNFEGPGAIFDATNHREYPKGMHGYDADTDPDMMGFLAIWEPAKPATTELGAVSWEQLHPTVAMLLGVRPGASATGVPLPIEGTPK